jgi:diadenosine tetraphosphate (Ap4A) HIT family hydrolase
MRGYRRCLRKRHAVELYELPTKEASAFVRGVQRAAKAVHEIAGTVRLNYEMYGNTPPHPRLRLFPRYVGDAFEDQPLDPRAVKTPAYAPGEFKEFADRRRAAVK